VFNRKINVYQSATILILDRYVQFPKMTIKRIILSLIILIITSCDNQKNNESNSLTNEELYPNYLKSVKNESTFQNFLVVKVKNLNNGEVREYCTQGNFLKGALHRELNLGYSKEESAKVYQIAINNKERYFEFKNDSAIWNISAYHNYTMKELSKFKNKIEIDSLVYKIKNGVELGISISNDTEMKMYAHALFNKGILTGENNCFGGTLTFDNYPNKASVTSTLTTIKNTFPNGCN
jgi:hypothetical protein